MFWFNHKYICLNDNHEAMVTATAMFQFIKGSIPDYSTNLKIT